MDVGGTTGYSVSPTEVAFLTNIGRGGRMCATGTKIVIQAMATRNNLVVLLYQRSVNTYYHFDSFAGIKTAQAVELATSPIPRTAPVPDVREIGCLQQKFSVEFATEERVERPLQGGGVRGAAGGRTIKLREAAPSTRITAAQCLCVSQSVIDLG
ncbi:hypothetical protein J6590_011405 [Homalodisca vitripennis]|nr:hypothetical protein J6590_011405 [Homalodisca vitripennis]